MPPIHHGMSYPAPEPVPLPKDHLNDVVPFTITGVDFIGALYVQNNNGESKVHICVFACICVFVFVYLYLMALIYHQSHPPGSCT